MKKLTAFLFGCFALSATLSAQTYVTKHTANGTINPIMLDYNSFWATPEELHKYGNNGFSIVQYNENVNGNIVVSRSFRQSNSLLILNPLLDVPTGGNNLVISQNSSSFPAQIVLTHVNFALNSVIFSTQFSTTQTTGSQTVSGLIPIDAVYDGSQYVFLLMSGTSNNPSGRKLFLVAKIDLTNPTTPIGANQIQSWGSLIPGNVIPFDFYPNDIEYVDGTRMFVTGTCVDVNSAAVHFFVYNIDITNGAYSGFYFTQSNATYIPQRMFVKSEGTNAYFIGENKIGSGTGPTVFASYDITSAIFGINNYTNYDNVVDWTNMTSSYYSNNQIVVGGKLASTPNRAANLLYNTSTGALIDAEYYTMSGNPARSIISPASGRVFSSVKVSNTEWDVFRTGLGNLTPPCKSANLTAHEPVVTMSLHRNKLAGYDFSPTFSSYAVVPLSPTFTSINHCGIPLEEGRMAYSSANSDATVLSVYPNPGSGRFNLSFYSEQEGVRELKLQDLAGREVYTHSLHVTSGENAIEFTAGEVKPGIYLLQLEGAAKTVKIVIQE